MRIKKFIKSEKGAAQMVQAAIIYPVVFMFLFFLIYVGLYILQSMTVTAYAQKVAMLAAREVAYPGYINLVSNDIYNTAATEADFGDGIDSGSIDSIAAQITLNFNPAEVKDRAYRYWFGPLEDDAREAFVDILSDLVRTNSILSAGDVVAEVDCENVVIAQFIDVTVEQKLMEFGVLKFFGIESPTVKASAKSSVSDTDELVRTTDFVVDAIETIATKLGVDVESMKEAVNSAIKTLQLD